MTTLKNTKKKMKLLPRKMYWYWGLYFIVLITISVWTITIFIG